MKNKSKLTLILVIILVVSTMVFAIPSKPDFYEVPGIKENLERYQGLESGGLTYGALQTNSEDFNVKARAIYEEALGFKQLAMLQREYNKLPITEITPPQPQFIPSTTVTEVYTTTSPSQKEIELSPYIREIATRYPIGEGIDTYLFLKSIIKIESDWKTRDISCAGAAGLVQLMPHTATPELKVKDPVVEPTTGQSVGFCLNADCSSNAAKESQSCQRDAANKLIYNSYARALINWRNSISDDQQLAREDERFDDRKAIEVLANYFIKSRDKLKAEGLPVTVENLAATYQAGRGIISSIKSNGGNIPTDRRAHTYAVSTRSNYNNLNNKQQAVATRVAGGCPGFPDDFVPIVSDDALRCSDVVCCVHSDLAEHVDRLRAAARNSGAPLLIVDAGRTEEAQREAFLDYLGGGDLACGPQENMNSAQRVQLAQIVPDVAGSSSARVVSVLQWLQQNDQNVLTIVNNLDEYRGCNHVMGRALDLRFAPSKMPTLGTATPGDVDIVALRNFMCQNGWANLGAEWWHYEFKTRGYNTARSSNSCYWGSIDGPLATVSPNYAYA